MGRPSHAEWTAALHRLRLLRDRGESIMGEISAVAAFVAAADAGRFQGAADALSISRQAVSKRIAALEKDLGVRLFTRTARGTRLTVDGQAFLPHTLGLLQAEERAAASVRPGRRALRVDVIGRRPGPAGVIAGSADLATFVGEQTHLLWPAHFDLRRVALRDPEPVYPHSLVWRRDNRHPALTALRGYLRPARREAGTWTPPWARQAA